MLPVAVYPQLVECAAPMTACDNPEFHYDFGVSLFIAGIGAMAASGPPRMRRANAVGAAPLRGCAGYGNPAATATFAHPVTRFQVSRTSSRR
jgi:hypothetical protein